MRVTAVDDRGLSRRGLHDGALLFLSVALIFALQVFARLCFEPPPPPPRAADAAPEHFSAARALELVARVTGDEPHPVGTSAHAGVRERLLGELEELGLEGEVQETIARGPAGAIALVRNVLARVPGRTSGAAVLVCAHYDSVAAGPGAGDDGAGVATLLEVARALSREPAREHPVWFLFTDAEELGLVGA